MAIDSNFTLLIQSPIKRRTYFFLVAAVVIAYDFQHFSVKDRRIRG